MSPSSRRYEKHILVIEMYQFWCILTIWDLVKSR